VRGDVPGGEVARDRLQHGSRRARDQRDNSNYDSKKKHSCA